MKHNIKLAAVDIDGIFVRLDYTYDVPRFKRILSRMKQAGCSFIVASGNQYYQMREELSFVAENGAFVKDRQAERRGILPEQCAALNRTNIGVQNMPIEAAHEHSRDKVYMAAYLDPHTAAELSMDEIKSMCDDLFEAHRDWLPKYR